MYEYKTDHDLLNIYLVKEISCIFKGRNLTNKLKNEMQDTIEQLILNLRIKGYIHHYYEVNQINDNSVEVESKMLTEKGREFILCKLQTPE